MPATAEQKRLSSLEMLDDSDDEEFDSDSDLEEPSASRQSNGRPQNGVSSIGSQQGIFSFSLFFFDIETQCHILLFLRTSKCILIGLSTEKSWSSNHHSIC